MIKEYTKEEIIESMVWLDKKINQLIVEKKQFERGKNPIIVNQMQKQIDENKKILEEFRIKLI